MHTSVCVCVLPLRLCTHALGAPPRTNSIVIMTIITINNRLHLPVLRTLDAGTREMAHPRRACVTLKIYSVTCQSGVSAAKCVCAGAGADVCTAMMSKYALLTTSTSAKYICDAHCSVSACESDTTLFAQNRENGERRLMTSNKFHSSHLNSTAHRIVCVRAARCAYSVFLVAFWLVVHLMTVT